MKFLYLFILLLSNPSFIFSQEISNVSLAWSGNSVNTVVFRRNSVVTYKKKQFTSFYDSLGNVILAKRKLGSNNWEIKKTPYKGNYKDAHNSISIIIDGADLVLVEVEVVDENGQRCPTALNMINFNLEGPAEWKGGIAQGPNNYILSQSLPVEGGVNRVLIRSALASGKIKLTATADKLEKAVLEFESKSIEVKDGLSKFFPADGLTSNLDRGPTPKGASFKPSRETLQIVNATAGANDKDVKASFDSNELSSWTNDGKLSTAWITYELARKSRVDEVILKLNGFRTRQYPIKIMVDGQEVFNGLTDRSLGYVLVKCKPTVGSKVSIYLADNSLLDNKPQMVEMNGKNLDDGNSPALNAKGSLAIIEAEIYKSLIK